MDGYEYIARDVSQQEFLNYNGYASQLAERYKILRELLDFREDGIRKIVNEMKNQYYEAYINYKSGYKSDSGETFKTINTAFEKISENLSNLESEIENLSNECSRRRKVYMRMHENCTNLIKEIGLEDAYKYKFTIFGVAATAKKK